MSSNGFAQTLREIAVDPDRKVAERALHVLTLLDESHGFRSRLAARLKPFPSLRTPRLTLREIHTDDAEDYFEQLSSLPADSDWRDTSEARSLESCRATLRRYESPARGKRTAIRWLIVDTSNSAIGLISLSNITNRPKAELGFWLGSSHWGQGLMTEAVSQVVHFAFTDLRMDRLSATTRMIDTASQRVLEKVGFRREPAPSQDPQLGKEGADTTHFSLLRSDTWRASHSVD